MSGIQDEETGPEGKVVDRAAGGGSARESSNVNLEVSARIEERLASVNFGEELAAEGVTTVCLDADGNVVEYRPDGTRVLLTRS